MDSLKSIGKSSHLMRSLVLKSLAVLLVTTTVACKSMHQPKRVDKSGKGKNDKPTDGRNKPIAQRGFNANGYLYLTSTLARNSLRLIAIAVEGEKSAELLDCQKLVTKSSTATEAEYSIVSKNCPSTLEGEESFKVTLNNKEVTKITSENKHGLKLRKIKKSTSESTDILSEILIASTVIERTEVGIFKVTSEAYLDYTVLGQKARFNDTHNVDLELTGTLNLTEKDKVLFELTESTIDHTIKRNGEQTGRIQTLITRSETPITTDTPFAMTCSIPSATYNLKQDVELFKKTTSVTVQLSASKGSIHNAVTKSKFTPSRECDQNYLQIADALRTVTYRERGFSSALSGGQKKETDSRGNPVKRKNNSKKSDKNDSKDGLRVGSDVSSSLLF